MNQENQAPKFFTTEQILEVGGTSLASLKEILRLGLIAPTQPSKGKRQRNRYQFKDAVLIKTVRLLSEEGYPRKFIVPLAFGSGVMELENSVNPLSLEFAPFLQRKGISLNEYPLILLKIINYRSFYKVSFENTSTNSSEYRLIKVGKKPKSLSLDELNIAEQRMCRENIYPFSNPLTLVVNLSSIHLAVKLKLMGMGLI